MEKNVFKSTDNIDAGEFRLLKHLSGLFHSFLGPKQELFNAISKVCECVCVCDWFNLTSLPILFVLEGDQALGVNHWRQYLW